MKESNDLRRIERLENLVIALFLHLKSVNKKIHELTLRHPDLIEMQIEVEKELQAIESFMRVKR